MGVCVCVCGGGFRQTFPHFFSLKLYINNVLFFCISVPAGPTTQPSTIKSVKGTRKEGNVLFNDALNTFYLRLYGIRHMVKDHSDSERGNLLPPHGLLFPINSKGSFICTIPQTG